MGSSSNAEEAYEADADLRYLEEGIFWPWILPYAEQAYYWVLYFIFLVPFSIKETIFSMVYILDMAVCLLIVNPALFVLQRRGFFLNRRYNINPINRWYTEVRQPRSPLVPFLVIALCIYIWIILGYIHASMTYKLLEPYVPILASESFPFTTPTLFSSVLSFTGVLSTADYASPLRASTEFHEAAADAVTLEHMMALITDPPPESLSDERPPEDVWKVTAQQDKTTMKDAVPKASPDQPFADITEVYRTEAVTRHYVYVLDSITDSPPQYLRDKHSLEDMSEITAQQDRKSTKGPITKASPDQSLAAVSKDYKIQTAISHYAYALDRIEDAASQYLFGKHSRKDKWKKHEEVTRDMASIASSAKTPTPIAEMHDTEAVTAAFGYILDSTTDSPPRYFRDNRFLIDVDIHDKEATLDLLSTVDSTLVTPEKFDIHLAKAAATSFDYVLDTITNAVFQQVLDEQFSADMWQQDNRVIKTSTVESIQTSGAIAQTRETVAANLASDYTISSIFSKAISQYLLGKHFPADLSEDGETAMSDLVSTDDSAQTPPAISETKETVNAAPEPDHRRNSKTDGMPQSLDNHSPLWQQDEKPTKLSTVGPTGTPPGGSETRQTMESSVTFENTIDSVTDTVSQYLVDKYSPMDVWKAVAQQGKKAATDLISRIIRKQVMQFVEGDQEIFLAWIKAKIDEQCQQQQKDASTSNLDLMDTEAIVQETIRRLSLDILMKPDYALASRGANVIMSLTTATYIPDDGYVQSVLRAFFNFGLSSNLPLMALTPDTHVGSCWPMKGSQGSLGILLSTPVFVEGITIEYAGKELMVDQTSAPKDIVVYGLLNYKYGFFRDTYEKTRLGAATYDIHNNFTIQTFSFEMLRFSTFKAVLLQIESNWGNPDYTCLYRLNDDVQERPFLLVD
ncbi:UNC-like C-terminal-domain-containing protein [Syncephalastrum racemosum]|uniref:UNC-like C-terminal-domain-containing protein n=1 Tax=Syncephalastrum racemosum TaxID=13706 RepID=A0A1X2H803_SYNRA|nr:UNC-like C-terminal-domain-containing protein [Syncephalastrum racemosum]